MANVYLDLLVIALAFALTKLLPNLEEALLDLALDPRLKLLLHVVKLKVLALEVLEWITLLLGITGLHVTHDRFLTAITSVFRCCCGVLHLMSHVAQHTLIIRHFRDDLRSSIGLERPVELAWI